jgi:hypothetical protein
VSGVTVAELLAEIRGWDFRMHAEGFGIGDDEAVDRALASLKLDAVSGTGEERFRLTYGPPDRRPILIHISGDPEVVEEERGEAEELLDRIHSEEKSKIRSHLSRMVEVIMVELGWSQLEDMGVVFAGMVSEHMAFVRDGLIRDPYDAWWAIDDHIPIRLTEPE